VSNNPRSTVGTITEIYDFYRLLYTSIGTPYCPDHPTIPLKKDSLREIVSVVSKLGEGQRFHILMPITLDSESVTVEQLAKQVTDMGFVRYQIGDIAYSVADTPTDLQITDDPIYIVVDRLIRKMDPDFDTRLTDSLRIALEKGDGRVAIYRE
jgi:excinuclease ABC subunit A